MMNKASFSPVTAQTGGWWTLKMSRNVRVQSQTKQRFRQFARIQDEFGPHEGDTYQITKQSNLSGRGQIIGEYGNVPVSDWTTTYTQVTSQWLTNSIALTQEADLFSELSVIDAGLINLVNEANASLDLLAGAPFKNCDAIYTPTGTMASKTYAFSTTGTPAATATRNVTLWDLRNINDMMRTTYRVPFWEDSSYICVTSPLALRGIREDADFIDIMKYSMPNKLLNSEIGKVENFRMVEETNVLSNSLAGGLLGEAVFFGYDPVVGVEVYPFELQAAVADPYGRFRNVRYVWRGGYTRTWTYAADSELRIIRLGSL